MCDTNGIYKETFTCGTDEWCTGPATQDSAITLANTNLLCERG